MILAVDATALVYRYAQGNRTELVQRAMEATPTWVVSELAVTELHTALHRISISPRQHESLSSLARSDLEAFYVVPVDGRCLAEAAGIAETYQLSTTHAVHLAAATRLGDGVSLLTFAEQQIGPAELLGLDLVVRATPHRRATPSVS